MYLINAIFDRNDVSEGIDVNKTSKSKRCVIRHSLDKGFQFQPNVCNGCHDLLMMSMNLSDTAILNIKRSDHRCNINGISKNEATNLMQNTDWIEKYGTLQNLKIYYHI